ncbi:MULTISPECIES: hypothetical protein [unclassified Curtobacterium]|uniref:hypothetical protein n=1 Tax=unclassified Curtobacterium TaxID=257496 RepID=UPI001047704C|nr:MULTISPECIES: hypothetical protein [unclassified Curtobacterium]TCL76655.1 hypothetical protein EDF23_10990 [Curtobacterium sp. PhB128]TCL91404.1 hypothetical protein EDF29_11167 [Curtobacterium sp. PhB138]
MTTRTRPLRLALAGLLVALSAGGAALVGVAPASAAGRVSVAIEGHPEVTNQVDSTYLTTLRLSGSGFQGIKNGYGGIYVAFGTVNGTWQPSKGGATGADYSYVPDDESNPTGYLDFVAFEGSTTASAANGGTVDSATGTWSATLKVPGSTFQALDRNGAAKTVDCTVVQCGIITIGAHGVANANNESFTPVSVQNLYGSGGTLAGGGTRATTGQAPADTTDAGSASRPSAEPSSEASADTRATTKPSARSTAKPSATAEPTASATPTVPAGATPSAVAAAAADGSAGGIDPSVLRIVLGGLSALVVAVAALVVFAIVHSRRTARRTATDVAP